MDKQKQNCQSKMQDGCHHRRMIYDYFRCCTWQL